MKLSIITVNLNNVEGLRKTAESIVSQTFQDFEWIVIDGGSNDGSKELIEQYSDHIEYWCTEKDSGIYNAMNKGVRHAKGEYVNFMNSGDWFVDNMSLMGIFDNSKGSEIIYGNSIEINAQSVAWFRIIGELSFKFMLDTSLCHQASFIPRELLLKYPYNETFKVVSDWEFFLKMILYGVQYKYENKFICYYDKGGISATNDELNKQERKQVLETLVPRSIFHDLSEGKTGELMELRQRHKLFSKFITFCVLLMKKIEKFQK